MSLDASSAPERGTGESVDSGATPLTIVTGFLGAGKTTLLNRILGGGHGLRAAVLVNDFGSINIDADLIVGVADDMISLANGCVCCEIRDDLLGAVERLVSSEAPPEHIILEASGVADPAGIWATFAGSQRPDWVRLDGVTCVVDTEQIFEHLDEAPDLLMLKARQIGFADLVVLNKVDLAGPATVAWVRQWIDAMMDRVRIVEAVQADVPPEILLGVRSEERGPSFERPHGGLSHREQFETWTFRTSRLFDPRSLQEMIRRDLPGEVYRCKGFVRVDGDTPKRMLLQSVGRRSELTPAGAKATATHSEIVAIGTSALDPQRLHRLFEQCLVTR
ncbi:GTP-binding protein [Rhodococcus sp. NPDC049939]|uniref:CobW family GTP-binding protein n=1 Tax=Rhodococcus sp. NPDC049939 TaxID=3155511 RepID=UPI0033FEB38A